MVCFVFDILFQALLKVTHFEIPMFCRAHDRRFTRDDAFGIDEIGLVVISAAIIALVTAGAFVAAIRAGAFDVAVWEEHLSRFIIELIFFFFDEQTFIEPIEEKFLSRVVVFGQGSARENIETHTELLKRKFICKMILIDDFVRRGVFFFSADSNSHSMLIRTAHKEYIASGEAQKAGIHIGRQIRAGKMSEMEKTINVGKRCCNESLGHGIE